MSKPKQESKVDIPTHVIKEILTSSEIRMLKNRWQIIQYLEDDLSIRRIAEKVKVGTDTVVRVARMLEKNNLRKLLDKNQTRKIKTNTPWIFGKND